MKKQIFFPIDGTNEQENIQRNYHEDVMPTGPTHDLHEYDNETPQTDEHQHQIAFDSEPPDNLLQSSDLISAAEKIIQENSSSSDNKQDGFGVKPVIQTQSHIRNLNLDLDVATPGASATFTSRSSEYITPRCSVTVTPTTSAVTTPSVSSSDITRPLALSSGSADRGNNAPVVFESQESYHNIDVSPKCLNLKTPTKVTFIQEPIMTTSVVSNQGQAPLQDSGKF